MNTKEDDEIKNYWSKLLIFIIIIGFGYLSYYKFFMYDKRDISNNNVIKKEENNSKEKNDTGLKPSYADDPGAKIEYEDDKSKEEILFDEKTYSLNYKLAGNTLENFDLYFMKMENNKKNKVYSPLSIKYALEMLSEGANGNSKEQIDAVIGDYKGKKYINNKNMSFANALFIRDTKKDNIKSSYIDTLKNKYNAEVVYDSFSNSNNINKWISDKTLNLIPNLIDKVDDKDFILTNALGIDMEWKNKIQSILTSGRYHVVFPHRTEYDNYTLSMEDNYTLGVNVDSLSYRCDYEDLQLKFENVKSTVASLQIAAAVNKYDIINELGEENIRKTVGSKYEEWLNGGCEEINGIGNCDDIPKKDEYLNSYINEISSNYKHISSSTDFEFYDDDDVKMFAKDLKKYNGTTLQYVGIMPKKDSLQDFINNSDSVRINNYINNLKDIKLENFDDKYITIINGYIPVFKFDYELNLMEDLKKLKIEDIFDLKKSNLSNLTTDKNDYVNEVKHKSNIEFSNDGIKAVAVTESYIGGAAGPIPFDYLYKVPLKKIDLTFNRPYMFIIRDKESKEVWFIGTVYEPIKWSNNYYGGADFIANCF